MSKRLDGQTAIVTGAGRGQVLPFMLDRRSGKIVNGGVYI